MQIGRGKKHGRGGECAPGRGRNCAGACVEPLELRRLLTRLAVIGDYSADTQVAPVRDVSNLVKSWNPDGVLTVGDNNYQNGGADTIDANIGQWYHQFIYPYTGSYGAGSADNQNHFWPALGNHDWNTPRAPPHRNYFTLPNDEGYYTMQFCTVPVCVVDSDEQEPDGSTSTRAEAN